MFEVDWPAPDGVRAVCSTRDGGVSAGPYASLNLGDHVGDDAIAVAENRQRFASTMDARPVFLQQVHGFDAVQLASATPHGTRADAFWRRCGIRGSRGSRRATRWRGWGLASDPPRSKWATK